jgi:hypothetical protein
MNTAIAPAPAANRERVLRMLAAGKTVQFAADALSIRRQDVMRVVQSTKGWLHDRDRDTVYEAGRRGMAPQLPDGISPAVTETGPEARLDRRHSANDNAMSTISDLIGRARQLDDKAVQRELKKTLDAIAHLRRTVDRTEQKVTAAREREQARAAARAEIEELQSKLAAAKTRARELSARGSAAAGQRRADPDPKKVRAWAKEHGVEVNEMGRVPRRINEQYLAATGGTP